MHWGADCLGVVYTGLCQSKCCLIYQNMMLEFDSRAYFAYLYMGLNIL